jgi:ribonucleoside-diphosphate reductase beta chain
MRDHIITTSGKGLNKDSLPFRLYQKAKKYGNWDPRDIDLSQDREDWKQLTPEQRESTLRTLSLFQAGEEAVTLDLLPLIMTIAKEGRLEEEMFLTTFLYEEAKHTEFFNLVLDAIGENGKDLSHFHGPVYRQIFYEILPTAMEKLVHDQSPEAVADASVVYNMFIEGVLAETGYFGFYEGLSKFGKMPGLMKGVGLLKTDESRHIGYGTFLLQRLICEHPHLFDRVVAKMEELAPLSLALNQEGNVNNATETPYGVPISRIMEFSMKQLQVRMEILARAKGQTMDQIYKTSETAVGVL